MLLCAYLCVYICIFMCTRALEHAYVRLRWRRRSGVYTPEPHVYVSAIICILNCTFVQWNRAHHMHYMETLVNCIHYLANFEKFP